MNCQFNRNQHKFFLKTSSVLFNPVLIFVNLLEPQGWWTMQQMILHQVNTHIQTQLKDLRPNHPTIFMLAQSHPLESLFQVGSIRISERFYIYWLHQITCLALVLKMLTNRFNKFLKKRRKEKYQQAKIYNKKSNSGSFNFTCFGCGK